MQSKFITSNRGWVKNITCLLILLLTGAFSKAWAQCKFVSKSAEGVKIETALPNTFPIYHYLKDHKQEDIDFEKSVNEFKIKYPDLKNVIFKPVEIPNDPSTYIEIPENILAILTEEDKTAILSFPSFYKVIKSN